MENDVSVPSKSNKEKKNFFVGILKVTDKKSRIRICQSDVQSEDPDPYQNVTDPEHWYITYIKVVYLDWSEAVR